jgi:hypothetical protein
MSLSTTMDSADFYGLETLLNDDEQAFLHSVRDFMKSEGRAHRQSALATG